MSLAEFTHPGGKRRKEKQDRSDLKGAWLKRFQRIWRVLKARWEFHIGVTALHRGKYRQAAQLLERAEQVLQDDPFVQVHLGWAHWFLGHPVSARKHLLRATEIEPKNPAFWTLAGKLAALRGKWDEAEQLLRHAVSLAPNNMVAKSWLALVLLQSGLIEEALDILSQTPVADDPYLQARLVLLLERLVTRQGERLETIPVSVPSWLKIPPLGSIAGYLFRWRGERLLEDGDWERAAKFLGAASQLRPKDKWAKLLWAVALLEGGFLTQAENVLSEVTESVPEKAWVYGALLVRRQKVREAKAWLPEGDDQHPFVRYYLALALDWEGEAEFACAVHLEPLYREDPAYLRQRIWELLKWLRKERDR